MADTIYRNCDNRVFYRGATDPDGNYLNNGTCSYVVKDRNGVAVDGASGNMPYVALSNGNYEAIIDKTVAGTLTNLAYYTTVITFSEGNYDDTRVLPCVARDRT